MNSAKRGSGVIALTLAFLLALSSLALGGCAGETGSKTISLQPKVNSPAVQTEGVLRVGVNSNETPYAGRFEGELVGIDVDIAAALAEELGLKLELVDLASTTPQEALTTKAVDVIMDVEQDSEVASKATLVGPYLQTGAALFTVVKSEEVPKVELTSLAGTKIAAQKESISAWTVDELIGTGTADPRETLDAALTALERNEVTYAAADAVKGSYLALNHANLACVKMLGTSIPVYLGVASDNSTLADALMTALRTLRDTGELKIVIAKWLGPVSSTVVLGEAAIEKRTTSGVTTDSSTTNNGQVDTGDDLPDPANAGGV